MKMLILVVLLASATSLAIMNIHLDCYLNLGNAIPTRAIIAMAAITTIKIVLLHIVTQAAVQIKEPTQ
jgi:hypothetical protein